MASASPPVAGPGIHGARSPTPGNPPTHVDDHPVAPRCYGGWAATTACLPSGGTRAAALAIHKWKLLRAPRKLQNIREVLERAGTPAIYAQENRVAPGDRQTLRVEYQGNQFAVIFDAKKVIAASEDSYSAARKLAVWAKAESVSLFDDFTRGSK